MSKDTYDEIMDQIEATCPACADKLKVIHDLLRKINTLPPEAPRKPDGYAVVLDDKSSPVGYWFAYAYIDVATAEKAAGITKGRVAPISFVPSPLARRCQKCGALPSDPCLTTTPTTCQR